MLTTVGCPMRKREALRPVQIRMAEEIKQSQGLQLVAGMGSGKTLATLTAIRDLLDSKTIRGAIIIAPVRVALTTWPDEIRQNEHTSSLDFTLLSGSPEQRMRRLKEPHQLYICSIDLLVWLIDALRKFAKDDPRWDMLVIDELSRMKSARGERAKKLNRFSERFDAVIGLTGTPRPNGWHEQWMPLNIVSGGEAWGTGYDGWLEEHFKATDFQKRNWEIRPEHIERVQKVIDDWSMTIPHDEATDIPFNFGPEQDIVVPLTKAQRDDMASLETELLVELGADGADLLDPSEELLVALSQATASGKMSQICQGFLYKDGETLQTYGKAKLEALNDLLEGANGENVMLAYHYRHDLEVLRARFGQDVPTLGSDTSEDQAAEWINAWNRGEVPVLLFHPASAGHGLNLQHGGRRMIWYCGTWSPEMFAQACKRLARPGQKDPVFVHRILADHWYEHRRVQRVESKMADEAEFISQLRTI